MSSLRPRGRLSKTQRIRTASEYRMVLNCGVRVTSAHFVFVIAPQQDQHQQGDAATRLGLIVSRKVGVAVARNRMKRLVREAFRTTRSSLPRGIDLVVIARRPSDRLRATDVVDEWLAAQRRIEVAAARSRRKACCVDVRQTGKPTGGSDG